MDGCTWLHVWPHGRRMAWLECMGMARVHGILARMNIFSSIFNFDQFSSILYDFCMISTIPNNSTQKHKYGENTQLYAN